MVQSCGSDPLHRLVFFGDPVETVRAVERRSHAARSRPEAVRVATHPRSTSSARAESSASDAVARDAQRPRVDASEQSDRSISTSQRSSLRCAGTPRRDPRCCVASARSTSFLFPLGSSSGRSRWLSVPQIKSQPADRDRTHGSAEPCVRLWSRIHSRPEFTAVHRPLRPPHEHSAHAGESLPADPQ